MQDPARKSCACTGVRWCAECRDPRVRAARKMDEVVPRPPLLAASDLAPNGRTIHAFALEQQWAPTCPDFEGVRVLEDFVSPGEAAALLDEIERAPFQPSQSGKLKQHYGPKVNFNKRRVNVSTFDGIPGYARRLERKLRALLAADATPGAGLRRALAAYETTDVFVLRYAPERASNLDFHLDDTFAYGEMILDLSLESDSTLTFYRGRPGGEVGGPSGGDPACVRVPLPARSLAVLYGAARLRWEHAILPEDIEARRTSITLRSLAAPLRRTDAGAQVLRLARRAKGNAPAPVTGPRAAPPSSC